MKILKSAYHRNGVGGRPFYVYLVEGEVGDSVPLGKTLVVRFCGNTDEGDKGTMDCAAFDMSLLRDDVIEFGVNSWRGDRVSCELDRVLAAKEVGNG